MTRIKAQLQQMVLAFKEINPNAKKILFFEPIFTIPYAMFIIYSSLYMTRVGVKDYQIGLLSTVLNLVMLITSPFAGLLVNKFGRKKVLLIGDFLSWCVYAYIFFFAKDFTWFLIATVFNGLMRIPELAWRLLLMEDATENERVAIYSVTVFVWNMGNLFAPLMGVLVARFGLVPATKWTVLAFGILVNILIVVRHLVTSESSVGQKLVQENSDSNNNGFSEWFDSLKYMFRNRQLLLIVLVTIFGNVALIFRDTYKNIYLSEALHYPDSIISVFPTLWSAVALIFVIFLIPNLKEQKHDTVLFWGMLLITVSNALILVAPPGTFGFILMIIVTVLGSIGAAVYYSFVDAILANSVDDARRAHVLSITMFLISLFSMPVGAIAGQCYTFSKSLPFVLATIFTLLCTVLIFFKVRIRRAQERQ
ncbi:major facilitator superfamily MFS_1 [Caldicellulosiruptor hydrothermalis 108]|uniref:Major facilitator superfamily MFS_1 n=1 Tax=Caldicellulosiruptor hydrothermalis (strain DSM 18901 / VKM B-2411 / 108) TaxID=632292 RepID=E4Q8M3_CALH1|nr:MFS transporter [Caldicellulosiruptor hydrothermalis]ADQ07997.1 major facilitator superfamily MFS_1 [Caldicellulosiruptor hydrothermalis 108]